MPDIMANQLLINGLRQEFNDTYLKIRNRQSDSRLSYMMDLGMGATNRYHDFAYIEAGPHAALWQRGDPIPQDGMGSVLFRATVHNYGIRVKWHSDDREDDQTGSLLDGARMAGESFGLLPERMFFDLLAGTTTTLPAVPLAPDGVGFFSATDGDGGARFGVTGGNLVTQTGTTTTAVLADYYTAMQRWRLMQDGKGQPLFAPEIISQGVIILHSAETTQLFEEAFLQKRQGLVYGSNTAAATPSNIILDSSRDVELFPSPRITGNDFYIFLKNAPKKPTFRLERKAVMEETSMRGENNSDLTRTTGEEYIQWHSREGAGIALPYAAIKVA